MRVLSANFEKTFACKREYYVIRWRHKQRISSDIDRHKPLKFGMEAYNQAVAPWVAKHLHATASAGREAYPLASTPVDNTSLDTALAEQAQYTQCTERDENSSVYYKPRVGHILMRTR